MLAIARAESYDLDPKAHNTTGEDSRGIFQINSAHKETNLFD